MRLVLKLHQALVVTVCLVLRLLSPIFAFLCTYMIFFNASMFEIGDPESMIKTLPICLRMFSVFVSAVFAIRIYILLFWFPCCWLD